MKRIVKIIRPERPPLPPAPYADGYYIALVGLRDEPEVVQYGNRRFYQFGTYDEPETVRVIAPVSVTPTFEYRIEYEVQKWREVPDKGVVRDGVAWVLYLDMFHVTPDEALERLSKLRTKYPPEQHSMLRLVRRSASEWSVVE